MSIEMKQECAHCGGDKPASAWNEIGDTVYLRGGNAGDTSYKYFQCGHCGEVWTAIRDHGGIGGNSGPFYSKIHKAN